MKYDANSREKNPSILDTLLKLNYVTADDNDSVSDLIDDYNSMKYREPHSSSKKLFVCSRCKRDVSEDDSYSSQGLNLHCVCCVAEQANKENISTAQWCIENIWSRGAQG